MDYIREKQFPVRGTMTQNMIWGFGLRSSQSRVKIFEVFSPLNMPHPKYRLPSKPLTIEEIVVRAEVSSSTAYRVVDTFVKVGILNKINLGNNCYSYTLSLGPTHYHHAVCTKCGTVEELSLCNKRDLELSARGISMKFENITNHSLQFFGLCRDCHTKYPQK